MANVVLITGVARPLGGAFARALSASGSADLILGVDVVPPAHSIGDAQFLRADIRSPMIGKIIDSYAIDTVVHMGVIATPLGVGGRTTQKEINVIGTMQLLAAAQKSPQVRRLVVKSTAGVYGSSHRDPAMFTEEMAAKALPKLGFAKDSVDVESYVRGFARRRPDVEISLLRFANVIGPRIRTAMTDYFRLPLIPVPLGWDGRLQFVHEDDVIAATLRATTGPAVGTVNVAGDGVITVGQAAALTGRPWARMPVPACSALASAYKRAGQLDASPEQLDLFVYGRGLDTSRMRTHLGFTPQYSTRAAFTDFIGAGTPPLVAAGTQLAGLGAQVRAAVGALGTASSTGALSSTGLSSSRSRV